MPGPQGPAGADSVVPGPQGPQGNIGNTGAAGQVGQGPVSEALTFSTNTASPPANGEVRVNNAAWNGVTHIYVNKTDRNGNNLAPLLQTLIPGTYVKIYREAAPSTVFMNAWVTAVTDNGTWLDLTVSYQVGAGAPVNSAFQLVWTPTIAPGEFDVAFFGLKGWTTPIDSISSSQTVPIGEAGRLHGHTFRLTAPTTLTRIWAAMNAVATLTAGQCFAGIADLVTGALLATTTDTSVDWATSGVRATLLTAPVALAAGDYDLVWHANGSALPQFLRPNNISSALFNLNRPGASPRCYLANSGLTVALPNPVTGKSTTNTLYWFGVQ